jgi:hypothetical protein
VEKTVVSFVTGKFDLSWPKGADPALAPPWGKDCAAFLAQQLPRFGLRVPSPEPDEQEGGWYLKVASASGAELMVFVSWWPVGSKPERNLWVVQVRPWPSFLPAFLRRKVSDEDYRAVCEAIDKVITADIQSTEVRWLSKEEFSKL